MSETLSSDPLAGVRRAVAEHGLALSRLERADAARVRALLEARAAGCSLRELGRELGVSHVRVLQLTRDERSEHPPSDAPREATVPGRLGVGSEHLSFDAPAPRICVRGGCSEPAVSGRFCPRHCRA